MYIEFHSRSAFSFLEGASLPEDLISACAQQHMPAMALLDRDGLYGSPRFYLAAERAKLKAHIGAEVSCESFSPRRHRGTEKTRKTEEAESNLKPAIKNPKSLPSSVSLCLCGEFKLPLLVASQTGYQNLCQLITRMKLRAKKEEGAVLEHELEQHAAGLICLTGGDEGPLAAALRKGGPAEAHRCVDHLVGIFGQKNVYVELQRHLHREEETRNRVAIEIARAFHLPLLATNGVCYATRRSANSATSSPPSAITAP